MVRPSARCAVIRSSVTSTARTRGSPLPLLARAAVVTPCLQNPALVLQDNPPHGREVTWGEGVVGGERDRIQPELARRALAPRVDVHGLVAVEAVKEEAEGARDVRDRRHGAPSL